MTDRPVPRPAETSDARKRREEAEQYAAERAALLTAIQKRPTWRRGDN